MIRPKISTTRSCRRSTLFGSTFCTGSLAARVDSVDLPQKAYAGSGQLLLTFAQYQPQVVQTVAGYIHADSAFIPSQGKQQVEPQGIAAVLC